MTAFSLTERTFKQLYFCCLITIRFRRLLRSCILLQRNLNPIHLSVHTYCAIQSVYGYIGIDAILCRTHTIFSLLKVRMLFCIYTFTDNIRQHLQHSQVNVLALTLVNCTLRQIFVNGRIADAYITLATSLFTAISACHMLLRPSLGFGIILKAMLRLSFHYIDTRFRTKALATVHHAAGVHPVKQVLHHPVSHLLSTRIVNVKEVGHSLPKLVNGTLHTLQRTHRLSLAHHAITLSSSLAHLLTEPLRTPSARIRCKHLVSNLIVCFKFGIGLLHLLPNLRALHQVHHILPLLRIVRLQRTRPQVGILMHRCLSIRNPRVIVNLATNSKAISLTILGLEKAHMVSYLRIILVEDNVILRTVLTTTTQVVCRIFNASITKRRQKFACSLIVIVCCIIFSHSN